MGDPSYALDVYTGRIAQNWDDNIINDRMKAGKEVYLIVNKEVREELYKAHPTSIQTLADLQDYRITMITAKFLNPNTRPEVLYKMYLLKMTGL